MGKSKINYVQAVEVGLKNVLQEFGNVFAANIPAEQRDEVVKAAVLSWLAEQLTRAVQNKVHYTEAQVIERANNCARFGYGGLIHCLGGDCHISIPAILGKKAA